MGTLTSLQKKIGINTLYQLIGRFVTALAGLWVSRLIIADLGKFTYGEYQTVLAYATFFWLLTDFGLNAVAVRSMSSEPDKEETYFKGLVTLRLGLGLCLMLISWALLLFLPYSQTLKIAVSIGLITIFTQSLKGAVQGLFQTRLRYEFTFIADVVGTITFFILTLYALQHSDSVIPLIGAFTAGQAAMMILSVIFAQKISHFGLSFDRALLRTLVITTIPIGISLFFNVSNFKLDAVLLSVIPIPSMDNEIAVATYNIAYKFFEFGLIFPTFFMNAVYPVMVRSYSESFTSFKNVFWKAGLVLLGFGILGTIIANILAPWLISLIAGAEIDKFGDSIMVLRILTIQLPLFFLSSLGMWAILTFERQRALIWIYGIAFFTNVILNVLLIPKYNYFGAAITTGISEIVILVLMIIVIYPLWKEKSGIMHQ